MKLRLATAVSYCLLFLHLATYLLSSITHSLQYNHYLLLFHRTSYYFPWCLILLLFLIITFPYSLMDNKGIGGRSPGSGCCVQFAPAINSGTAGRQQQQTAHNPVCWSLFGSTTKTKVDTVDRSRRSNSIGASTKEWEQMGSNIKEITRTVPDRY